MKTELDIYDLVVGRLGDMCTGIHVELRQGEPLQVRKPLSPLDCFKCCLRKIEQVRDCNPNK